VIDLHLFASFLSRVCIVFVQPKGVEVDEDGLPSLPAGLPSPEQCCVM